VSKQLAQGLATQRNSGATTIYVCVLEQTANDNALANTDLEVAFHLQVGRKSRQKRRADIEMKRCKTVRLRLQITS